jgi:hypothetical protein
MVLEAPLHIHPRALTFARHYQVEIECFQITFQCCLDVGGVILLVTLIHCGQGTYICLAPPFGATQPLVVPATLVAM